MMRKSTKRLFSGISGFLLVAGSISLFYLFMKYMLSDKADIYTIYILNIGEIPLHIEFLAIPTGALLLMLPVFWGLQLAYFSVTANKLKRKGVPIRILAASLGLPLMLGSMYFVYLWAKYISSKNFNIDTSYGFRIGIVPIPLEFIGVIILGILTCFPFIWGLRLVYYGITEKRLKK